MLFFASLVLSAILALLTRLFALISLAYSSKHCELCNHNFTPTAPLWYVLLVADAAPRDERSTSPMLSHLELFS